MRLWSTSSSKAPEEQTPLTETSRDDPNLDRSLSRNDPAASAQQAAGTAWLAGHLHHLTPEQETKLEEFKKLCEEKGYYTPAKEGVKESHDDATMLYVSPFSLRWSGSIAS